MAFIAPTKLGAATANAAKPPAASRFAQAALGARVLHRFTIPRLELPAVMTLVSTARQQAIEAACHETMRTLGLAPDALTRTTEPEMEADRARRTLAEAVLDPDTLAPIGTPADWEGVDRDIIAECWRIYGDVREALDPVGAGLTTAEQAAIIQAIQKKNAPLLRFIGARRLAIYLLSTDATPSISATPTSSTSESSSEP